jgi:hypothetical protein
VELARKAAGRQGVSARYDSYVVDPDRRKMSTVKFPKITTPFFFQLSSLCPNIIDPRPLSSILRRRFVSMPKADSPAGFKPLKDTALFTPFKLGSLNLEHRIVQAPLTRMRATKESDGVFVPKDLHVEYYGQRASKGGLQLTEATDIAKYVSSLVHTAV